MTIKFGSNTNSNRCPDANELLSSTILFDGTDLDEYDGPIDDIDEPVTLRPILSETQRRGMVDPIQQRFIDLENKQSTDMKIMNRDISAVVDDMYKKIEYCESCLNNIEANIDTLNRRTVILSETHQEEQTRGHIFSVVFTLVAIVIISFSLIAMIMSIENRHVNTYVQPEIQYEEVIKDLPDQSLREELPHEGFVY